MVDGDEVLLLSGKIFLGGIAFAIPWGMLWTILSIASLHNLIFDFIIYTGIAFTEIAVFVNALLGWIEDNFSEPREPNESGKQAFISSD